MGFLSGIVGATVKTVLTPVGVVKDVVNVITDEEVDSTQNLVEGAGDDLSDALDSLADGDLI